MVYVKQIKKQIYIVVPEDDEQCILFHEELNDLMKIIYKNINEL